jgi:glycosyltransferase involved in cell wall biosynthesis/SAM-dependent methyltransferase
LRILLVLASLNPADGGPPESMRTLSRAFTRLGHDVEIVTLDDPGASWLGDLECPVTALGPGRFGKYRYAPAYKAWLRHRAADFDIVVVNGVYQYHSFATRSVLTGLGKPYVAFTHGALDPWFRRRYPLKHLKKWLYWPWSDYRVLRDATRVLFTTDEERLLARRSFWLYHADEEVVGYGTETPPPASPAHGAALWARFPQLKDRRFLLFLSRIDPKKGCDLLIHAFARVADRDPSLLLVMAGPDSIGWRVSLEALATKVGVADRIVWTGMLAGDDKWAAFRAADAFVLTSHTENFGIVVVEALACGTPVLISERVNIWREIAEAGAGLSAPDTIEGSEDLLRRWLASSPDEVARMRGAAARLFRERYELDTVAKRILEALLRAAAPHERSAASREPSSRGTPSTPDSADRRAAPICRTCGGSSARDLGALPPGTAFAGIPLATALPGGRLYRCLGCDLIYRHPIFDAEQYNALYGAAPLGVWSEGGELRPDQALVLDYLGKQFPNSARILDVGCYDGDLLARLPARFERYGIERSDAAASRAQDRGVAIIGHDLYAIDRGAGPFDAVIATDVIEHTIDPGDFIARLVDLLSPTGRLILTSGDADNAVWSRARANFWYCSNPEHISFIGHRWLRHLERAGKAGVVHQENFRYSRGAPRYAIAKQALVRALAPIPTAIRASWTMNLCADHVFVALERMAPPDPAGHTK